MHSLYSILFLLHKIPRKQQARVVSESTGQSLSSKAHCVDTIGDMNIFQTVSNNLPLIGACHFDSSSFLCSQFVLSLIHI